MNTINRQTNTYSNWEFWPIDAYLIESDLLKQIPENEFFQWQYTSVGSYPTTSRVMELVTNDFMNGKLATLCEQLLSEHIRPVIAIKAASNGAEWFEKYTEFSRQFHSSVQIRLIIDEYDECFSELRRELFFPDQAIMNGWSRIRVLRHRAIKIWPDDTDVNSNFFTGYELALRDWLAKPHHHIELQDALDEDIFADPKRSFEASEFKQKIQHRKNANGAFLSLTLNDLPCIKVEGEIEGGRVIACTSTGFFSEAFSQRIIAKAWESTETQRRALNFYPENWKIKADLELKKKPVDAASLTKSSYRSQDISFTCARNSRYRLTFRIDPNVAAKNAESFVILEVPQYLESKKLTINFDSRYTLNLTLSKESNDEADVYCQPEKGLGCNRWVGQLSLNHQQKLNDVSDIWDAFTVSDTDEGYANGNY